MPLLDHFHKPIETRMPWASVGMAWVVILTRRLNKSLPQDRYQAISNAHLGREVEADIGEYEIDTGWSPAADRNGDGGVATLAVPAAVATVETDFPPEFAVHVRDVRDNMTLVAAIEFVSPANKDRPEERERFAAKCLGYIDKRVGVTLVDIVTSRHANLHNVLVATARAPAAARMADVPTYVAAYRPHPDLHRRVLDLWPYQAPVGSPVPAVPLALKDGPTVMLDLDGTYTEAVADHGYTPPA